MRLFFKFICFLWALSSVVRAEKLQDLVVEPAFEESFVRQILGLELGDEFSSEKRNRSERFLRLSNRYESVSVEWQPKEGRLSVFVEAFLYFSDLVWVNDKPSRRSEIERNCFAVKESIRLSQARISQLNQCILEKVRGGGYLDAQVFVYAEEDILKIDLQLGEVYRINEIKFHGNDRVRASSLRAVIKNRVGQKFKAFEISEDTDCILKYYLRNSYYLTKVYQPNVEVSPESRSVNITWKIEESNRTLFVLSGGYNSRKHIETLSEQAESPPVWFIDKVVSEIKDEVSSEGYLSAVVSKEVDELRSGDVRVRINVQRGRQYLLSSPDWIGLNDPEAISKIYSKVARLRPGRFFNDQVYRKEFEEEFFSKLVERGYLDVKVRRLEFTIDQESARVTPVIYMNEGRPHIVGQVSFPGMPEDMHSLDEFADLKDAVHVGKAFNALRVEEFQQALISALKERGYLDVSIDRKADPIGEFYSYVFQINTGPRYQVSEIIIRGLDKTDPDVIRRELLFKEGEFFDQELIDDSISQILRLGISRSVDIQVLDKFPDEAKLYLIVEISEAARFRFEIGPGYGTADGLRGVFRATYANIGGRGRRLNLFSKASRELQESKTPNPVDYKDGDVESVPFIERRVTIEYLEPRLLNFAVDGRIALSHKRIARRDFSVLSNSAAFVLDWRINRHWTLSPDYKIEYSNPFNVVLASESQSVDDASPSRFNSIGARLFGTFLDDRFSPQKGFRSSFRADVFDERFGGNLNFVLTTTKQDLFYPLYQMQKGRSVGIALSLNAGFSNAYGSTAEIPVEKRYRVGGEGSVRGYPEDSIQPLDANGEPLRNGGGSEFFFRSELNVPLFGSFDLLGFFDGGNIYKTNDQFNPLDLRYGAGGGLRFNTLVGPVKFGYAFILGRQPEEDLGQIYFGIGPL